MSFLTVPIEFNANALCCICVNLQFAISSDCCGQMLQVGVVVTLDQEIIHCQCEANVLSFMPEVTFDGSLFASTSVQTLDEIIMCNPTGLFEPTPGLVDPGTEQSFFVARFLSPQAVTMASGINSIAHRALSASGKLDSRCTLETSNVAALAVGPDVMSFSCHLIVSMAAPCVAVSLSHCNLSPTHVMQRCHDSSFSGQQSTTHHACVASLLVGTV